MTQLSAAERAYRATLTAIRRRYNVDRFNRVGGATKDEVLAAWTELGKPETHADWRDLMARKRREIQLGHLAIEKRLDPPIESSEHSDTGDNP